MKMAVGALVGSMLAANALAHDTAQGVPGERMFELRVEGGKLVGGPKTIRIKQNEAVRLRWSTSEPMELHLHGYDVAVRTEPGKSADMAFKASATGRFPVRAHGPSSAGSGHHHGPPLVQIEVFPP